MVTAPDSIGTTRMENLAALQKLFTWLSPAFPVGSFAYSHGLEQAIVEGHLKSAADCETWIGDLLRHGTGRNDAILMAHAYRGEEVEDLALALAGSAERKRETLEQGAALARILSAVEGETVAGPYPLVLAKASARAALPLTELVALYLQAFAANLLTACIKSVPLGQTEGQRLQAALLPVIRAVTEEALVADLEDVGSCCLRSDLMAIRHETLEPRIYRT